MRRVSPGLPFDRRRFLGTAALLAGAASRRAPADDTGTGTAFFVIGDTHYLADAADPSRVDDASAAMTGALVDTLNGLVGAEIPEAAGGGVVRRPCGVLHAGDVIDTGDKQGGVTGRMQRTEIAAFERTMGLDGRDGALDFPVYEVHGNHDGPQATGVAIDRIVERNRTRPGLARVSADGLHYSWDSDDVHFVHLGIVVGGVEGLKRRRRYAPRGSLAFLVEDLREEVGGSGRPVVLVHHVDVARYTVPVPVDAPFADKEWDPADVAGFHAALEGYEVAAIFHGHTHARAVWRWDGRSVRPGPTDLPAGLDDGAAEAGGPPGAGAAPGDAAAVGDDGAPVGAMAGDAAADGGRRVHDIFNCDNSSHFGGPAQAFFYVELGPGGLVVREYATRDGWQSGAWTPLVWRRAGRGAAV